jgi:hypothetical protein
MQNLLPPTPMLGWCHHLPPSYEVVLDAFVFIFNPEPGLKMSLVHIGCFRDVKFLDLPSFKMPLCVAPIFISLFFHFCQAGVIIRKFIEMS